MLISKEKELLNKSNLVCVFDTHYHSWTKAICDYDRNTCTDYYIECEGNKLIDITPLTKNIYMGSNWTDPRPTEWINMWC
jgi:hypothetical protein